MKKLISVLAVGLFMACAFGGCIGTELPIENDNGDSGMDDAADSSVGNSTGNTAQNETGANTTVSNNTTQTNETGGNQTSGNETSGNGTSEGNLTNYHMEYSGTIGGPETFIPGLIPIMEGDVLEYKFPVNESAKKITVKVAATISIMLLGELDITIYDPSEKDAASGYLSGTPDETGEITLEILEGNITTAGYGEWILELNSYDISTEYTATIDVIY